MMRIPPGMRAALPWVGGPLVVAVLTLGSPGAATPLVAQDPGPAGDPITIGREHSLDSEILGEERRYKVHLPDGYGDPDWAPRHHPVLYVLDGEHTFNLTVGLAQSLAVDLQIPELIVVGIPNTDRVRDLTPTNDPVWRDGQEREGLRSSGGADDFLRFLERELVPHVDATYRTLPHRTLVGHSLGGLFAVYALLEAPGLFQAHIVSDPALDWDGRVLHRRLDERLGDGGREAGGLRGPVYISLANTPENIFLDPEEWAGAIRAFAGALEDRGPDELRSTLAYFEDEDHTSVLLPTILRGLRFVFLGHRPSFADILDRPSVIGPHFEAVAAELGIDLLPPEWFLEIWGQQWLLLGEDPDRAIEAFTVQVDFFPESHRGHDGLGMAWEAKGDTARAIEHFRRSLELKPDHPETRERLEALEGSDPLPAQDRGSSSVEDRFFETSDTRLHYLDFGGKGLPLLFMHSGTRTAWTYEHFAPRFTDRNRVLALTNRGVEPSEGPAEGPVASDTMARDALALLDASGIERAVIVHRWPDVLIYLAERHRDRVAGLVFLQGGPEPDPFDLRERDPVGVLRMRDRYNASLQGLDPDRDRSEDRESWYGGEYRQTGGPIPVPALAFADGPGTVDAAGWWEVDMEIAERVASGRTPLPDPVSRAFYERLARDPELQERVRAVYREVVAPAWPGAKAAFRRAFGDHLRWVPLDTPRFSGYEYRDAPELIAPHIRAFLDHVARAEEEGPSPLSRGESR